MLDKVLIKRKLKQIQAYLEELSPIAKKSKQDFVSSYIHYTAERLTELIVGNAIDINFHIIKELNFHAPLEYKESFIVLGKEKILSLDFAKNIADSAGLRNLLIHHYDKFDLDRFYDNLKEGIIDYEKYIDDIYKFIEK